MLEEEVQLRMAAGFDCNLKQRHEDVLEHLLEVTQLFLGVVHVTLKTEKYQEVSCGMMMDVTMKLFY